MEETFIQETKQVLLKEKARVEEELARFKHASPQSPDNKITPNNNLSLETTLEHLLRDIKKALENIQKGNYGTCKYCSKDINQARLEARPASASCINCKKTLTQEL